MPSIKFYNRIEFACILWAVICLTVIFCYNRVVAYDGTQRMTVELNIPEAPVRGNSWHVSVSEEDLQCMALNVYFEARDQKELDQYAIADVVMYRVRTYGYPDTVCGVIKDGIYSPWNPTMPKKWKCSFTWMCDRKPDVPRNKKAYAKAESIAHEVLTDPDYTPKISYALFYHAEYVNPWWASTKQKVAQRGTHIFYTEYVK